jgi:hypothetical protein
MKDLLPYRGLAPETIAALAELEAAERFAGHERAYDIVKQEAQRRAPAFLTACIPAAVLGAGLIWAAQLAGALPAEAPWAYAFGPILFTALVMSQLRPQAMRDDMRIGKALQKWRTEASAQHRGGK